MNGWEAHARLNTAIRIADTLAWFIRRNYGAEESAAEIAKGLDDVGWRLLAEQAGTHGNGKRSPSEETRALVVKILEDREAEHVPPRSVAS